MEYNIQDTDYHLDSLMTEADGIQVIKDLEIKIQDGELQLDEFSKSICHCDLEIPKYELIIRESSVALQKLTHSKQSDPQIKDRIQLAKKIRAEHKDKKLVFEENKLIWKISCYITLVSIDIKTMQKGLYSAKTEWDKRFFARHAYLIMYDAPAKIKKLLENMLERTGLNSIKTELIKAQEELESFVTENNVYINSVRNNTIGHKDSNVLNQLEIMQNINWTSTIKTTLAFETIINNLGKLLTNAIKIGLKNLDIVYSKDSQK